MPSILTVLQRSFLLKNNLIPRPDGDVWDVDLDRDLPPLAVF